MKNSNNKNSIIIGDNNNLTININDVRLTKINLFKIHCIVTIFCLSSSLILQLLGFANNVSKICHDYLGSASNILSFNKIFVSPIILVFAVNTICLKSSKNKLFNFFTYVSLLISSTVFFYILFMPTDFIKSSYVYIIISYINIICLKLISKDERRI